MANIRIKDQTTDTALQAGDYVIVDSASEGTRKFDLGSALSGGGTGLTDAEKSLILTLFSQAAYAENDAGTAYNQLSNLWSGYSITWSGSGYTHSNNSSSITGGSTFTSTVSASSGFTITGVVATMGGNTVQGAWNNGTVTIPNVTGNIVITVTTVQATVSSISALYTQSGTVYDTDSLDSLKSDLVVTATYVDQSTYTVPSAEYTLSGTLTAGTSTITVSYGGKTATFTVTVTHNEQPLYDWDFTQSLVDSVGGVTAVLTGCTRDSNGVNFTAASQAIQLTSEKVDITDKTYIIDVAIDTMADSGSNHARFLCSDSTDTNTATGAAAFVYRHNYGWTVYGGSSWGTAFDKTTYPIDFFNNKRVKIYIDTDRKLTVSYASIGSNSFTEIGTIALAFESTYGEGYLVIGGSNTNNFSPVTISAIKIYEGEV